MSEAERIAVTYINNDGEGFAGRKEIAPCTVREFFNVFVGNDPNDYMIRVNKEVVTEDHVLEDGDTISITPRNIKAE